MFARRLLWLGLLASHWAVAGPLSYDFRIAQLGNPQCLRLAADGSCAEGATNYTPWAEANFRGFARRLAAGLTAVNLAPPETLGHSGFAISVETSLVNFQDPKADRMPTNRPISGGVLIPSVHLRKGLPWSFEIGARAAWVEKSKMGAGTLELKWALNEGFTFLPDVGVRGHITKLVNSRDFDLTAGGVDLGLGKQFSIAGMATLTPYLGWDLIFVGASSTAVEHNPERGLAGAEAANAAYVDYQPYAGVSAGNNVINRFYGGARLIVGVAMLGVEVSSTVLGSFKDATVGTVNLDESVWATNFMLGLDF
jgi:hypothetical protein